MNWGTWLRAEWDRVAGFGLIGLGALFVLLGYLGVRNTPFVAEQMAYMASGGIGGLFCLGFGVGLLLSADFHDEWRKLDRLEAELRGDAVPGPEPQSEPQPAVGDADSGSASGPPGNGRHRPEPVPQPAGTAGAFAVPRPFDPVPRQAGAAGSGVALAYPLHPAGGTRRALAAVSLALLLPLAVACAGWRQASETADIDVAGRGLGLTVAAVTIALVFIAVWGLWMRAGVLRRRAAVTRAIRRWNWNRLSSSRPAPARPSAVNATGGGAVFVAPGHRRFHHSGCPVLEWLDAVAISRDAVDPGLEPCGLCPTP